MIKRIKIPRFEKKQGFNTEKKYSNILKQVKSKDSKAEILFRKKLWQSGIRYRKNVKRIVGKPDIVINKYKTIIFIDGDFWHGYNWELKKSKLNKNKNYWIPKIERNIQRDKEINKQLKKLGWTVIRIWEHDVFENLDFRVKVILRTLKTKGWKKQ